MIPRLRTLTASVRRGKPVRNADVSILGVNVMSTPPTLMSSVLLATSVTTNASVFHLDVNAMSTPSILTNYAQLDISVMNNANVSRKVKQIDTFSYRKGRSGLSDCLLSGCDCNPESPSPDSFCPFNQYCSGQCKGGHLSTLLKPGPDYTYFQAK